MKFKWELIYKSEDNITETWRAKVVGGWLVKDFNCVYTDSFRRVKFGPQGSDGSAPYETTRRYSSCVTMQFIKDEDHEWIIEK